MKNWPAEIVKGALIHQEIERLDRRGLWTRHFPEVAATESEVLAVEAALGFSLDEKYRTFLLYANGWRCFYQDVDLFGTRNLFGAPPMGSALAQLAAIGPSAFRTIVGLELSEVVPIAASELQRDIFVLETEHPDRAASVVWLSGGLVDRFSDFDEFFLAMLDYNRREVTRLKRQS